MKRILNLTFKKFFRTNQIVLLFLISAYIFLLFLGFYTRELSSFLTQLCAFVIPYACILLTGGQLKDEIDNGYMDIILHRMRRSRIVLGKFLGILIFSSACYILLSLILAIYLILESNPAEFKSFFIIISKGFIVTTYLISLGLFLSLYLKGLFNFAFVFFLQFATLVFMDFFMDYFFESAENIPKTKFFLMSLLSPQLIFLLKDGRIVSFGLIVSSVFIILLTIYLFKKREAKKG